MLSSVLLLCSAALATAADATVTKFTSASLAGLVGVDGKTFDEHTLQGKSRLVLFGFTSCADVCPLTLLAMRESLRALGADADGIAPLFISVDPDRDRGPVLQKYVSAFDARIIALTGPALALQKVASGHGIFFEKRWTDVSRNAYVYDHTASILLIGPDGNLRSMISSAGPPDEVVRRIVAAVRAP